MSLLWLLVILAMMVAAAACYVYWRELQDDERSREEAAARGFVQSEELDPPSTLSRIWELLNRPIWRPRR